jgi:hypothetical protein
MGTIQGVSAARVVQLMELAGFETHRGLAAGSREASSGNDIAGRGNHADSFVNNHRMFQCTTP